MVLIDFLRCEKITGKGLTLLWAQLNTFKSLDSLSFNFSGLTNAFIIVFKMNSCSNISDSHLTQLTKNLSKTMRTLKSFELFFTAPVKSSSALALGIFG